MLIERHEHRLYASHHQFYVEDGEHPGDTGDASFWTKAALADLIAVVPGTVGIGTGSHGDVRVITEIHNCEPPLHLAAWDHVAEASLTIKSSTLRVIGCLDDKSVKFNVAPGSYRVRCCYANVDEGVEYGEGPDWYMVQVWPAPAAPPQVLKRWPAAA